MAEILARVASHPIVITTAVGFAIVATGLWIATCWWAFRDAGRRAESPLAPYLAATWVFLSGPVLLPASVAVYALLRPQEVVGDRRSQRLLRALEATGLDGAQCPACATWVDPAWARCPACRTWLASDCPQCRRLAPTDAEVCPWCAWAPGDDVIEDGGTRTAVAATAEARSPDAGAPTERRRAPAESGWPGDGAAPRVPGPADRRPAVLPRRYPGAQLPGGIGLAGVPAQAPARATLLGQ